MDQQDHTIERRDLFACFALLGMIIDRPQDYRQHAIDAWAFADAMEREREPSRGY